MRIGAIADTAALGADAGAELKSRAAGFHGQSRIVNMRPVYPFSAIVGQDEMKLALLVAAIDPTIGGVLVFGDRGTGKSTAVRALAACFRK